MCREKGRLHAQSQGSNNPEHHIRLSKRRRAFKRIVEQKMRDNILTDDSYTDLIIKRFWSHVKSKTKSTYILEVVHRNEIYRSEVFEQA